ncbi:MAG: 3-hydroxyacyl-CoA dehydrogenase family protein [Candidatus Lokiarchaeota archaeon]|nr:3-hydroxyacyl-CoA dehydrogenase family protein [Candidatus Lokiarchaeota archaeon]
MIEIKTIAIVGSGLMGTDIAQVALMAGYNVVILDIKQEFVDKSAVNLEKGLKKVEAKGKLDPEVTVQNLMAKLSKSINLAEAVKNVDFVIEAVIEKIDIKKQVCKTVMENGPDHIIFASNTSTMSITEIGRESIAPERVCGMHFFNPVPLMRAIEVIKSADTSDDTFEIAMAVAKKLPCLRGSRYIAPVLKDSPGFIVNRMNGPVQLYLSWCFDQIAEKGLDWSQLDADAKGKMPMPPCVLMDFVGIDTAYHVLEYYKETLSPDFDSGKKFAELYNNKQLGQKTGKGFYDWSEGKDIIMERIKNAEPAGIFDLFTTFAIMLNEGCRILVEEIASGYKIIDDANMAGMNAPGPFSAGKKNYEAWSKLLDDLADKTGKEYFRPIDLMRSGEFSKLRK